MSQHGKNSVRGQFWSRYHASIIIPPQYWAGKFSCPYMEEVGLSWHYGSIISGPSTMRVLHFEMSPFHKICCGCCWCVQRACRRGSLTYWAHWAGYGPHATIVLLFGSMSHASVLLFGPIICYKTVRVNFSLFHISGISQVFCNACTLFFKSEKNLFNFLLFISFLAVLGLHCFAWALSGFWERGLARDCGALA